MSAQTAQRALERSPLLDAEILDLMRVMARARSRLHSANVIPWSSPVPVFGDVERSRVATIGLNPSNREFVDVSGRELKGKRRRFHTLGSLRLRRWADADADHAALIAETCRSYFLGNPYDTWFGALDKLVSTTKQSFYSEARPACHLDLSPFATASKWTDLTQAQRTELISISSELLGRLVAGSPIQLLVLNGATVVREMMKVTMGEIRAEVVPDWNLRRGVGASVRGVSYAGWTTQIGGCELGRRVALVGFNHNIQSSFGVTNAVRSSIGRWIGEWFQRSR